MYIYIIFYFFYPFFTCWRLTPYYKREIFPIITNFFFNKFFFFTFIFNQISITLYSKIIFIFLLLFLIIIFKRETPTTASPTPFVRGWRFILKHTPRSTSETFIFEIRKQCRVFRKMIICKYKLFYQNYPPNLMLPPFKKNVRIISNHIVR